MKEKVIISASVIVYAATALSLAVATFLSPGLYGSVWFFMLWGLFALLLAVSMFRLGIWRRGGSFLLHLSFLAMLGGGLLTFLTREKGNVRIAPGETATFFETDEGSVRSLPAPILLRSFEIEYYPGGEMPRDYLSHLIVDGEERVVSMNRILDYKGYRFCQSSYGFDGSTVLSVNHDPYGIFITYCGYILFAVGGAWILVAPDGRFRRLLRALGVAVLLICGAGGASASTIAGVPRATADSLSARTVIYGGREVTFNTLAREVLTKIYGSPTYRGLSAEQVVLSLRLFPERWRNEPLIKVKGGTVSRLLGREGDYLRLSDLFDSDGNYRVAALYSGIGERQRRSVEELDEKAGIILSLLSGSLIVASPHPLPEWKIRLELFYNSLPFSTLVFSLLFTSFSLSLLPFWGWRPGRFLSLVALCLATLFSMAAFIVQCILAGRLPLSNTFETLQFVVLATEVLILLILRRNPLLMSVSVLLAAALGLVAHLVEVNPVVTPLMPVLHSPWLSLHVSLVMTSYSLLLLTFVISVVAVVAPGQRERSEKLSLAVLYPAVWLLGLGIFSGAVWANVSWGAYWSWDSKETWALITLFVYAFPLHRRMFSTFCSLFGACYCEGGRALHIYLLFAILSVAMTYFGVNYLDSLHAYS